MNDWKKYTVQELIDLDMIYEPYDGNHGELHPKKTDYVSNGIPFIMANDLSNGIIDYETCAFISEEQAQRLRKGFARPGDVLLTHKATIGRTAIVSEEYPITILTPQVTYYRVKKGIDNRYLKYFFDSPYFQNVLNNWAGSGSTRAYLGITAQHKLPIMLPSLSVQKAISSVLSSIDAKIHINNQINKNLEQQAQALFKAWFVDFEPFGGVMPDNWKIGTVEELAKEIICGKTPSTKKSEYYGEYMPFITIPDMHNNVYTISTERYLSKLGVDSQAKKILPKNSICVSCIGTAGLVTLVAFESQTNQQINSIIPKEKYSSYYIYLLLNTMSEKINSLGQSGSTIVNLNKTQFGMMEALVPSVASMNDFDDIVKPLFEKILNNQFENQHLSEIRDTLLPKLMSGEIDVSYVKI